MEEILRDLARLRRYGSGLQNLLGELQRMAPERSEGTDPSGAVRATLGPDGLPETIRVSPYWKEKTQAGAFGEAVTAACLAAMRQRGADWSQTMRRTGWQERLDRLDTDTGANGAATGGAGTGGAGAGGAGTAEDADPVPPAFRRANGAAPRPLDVLAEESISLLDAALRPVPAPRPGGTGSNRAGTLEISLSAGGQVSCRADPRWVSQQSGAQLSAALSDALAAARDRLAAAASTQVVSGIDGTKADGLLQEILAVLGDPQRLADR
jgi:hypothetical protein